MNFRLSSNLISFLWPITVQQPSSSNNSKTGLLLIEFYCLRYFIIGTQVKQLRLPRPQTYESNNDSLTNESHRCQEGQIYKNRDGKSASKLVNVRCVVSKPRPQWVDLDGTPISACTKGFLILVRVLNKILKDKITWT